MTYPHRRFPNSGGTQNLVTELPKTTSATCTRLASAFPRITRPQRDGTAQQPPRGLAAAQYNLGALYEHGAGVPQDYGIAARHYQAAAAQGHKLAQARLGLFYENGLGVPQNLSDAMKFYLQAAQQGDRDAQCKVGYGYHVGLGVPRDAQSAIEWYRKAAETGMATAENNLSAFFHHGWGRKSDRAQALYWYHKAAEQGLPEAAADALYVSPEMLQKEFGSRYSGKFVIGKDFDVY